MEWHPACDLVADSRVGLSCIQQHASRLRLVAMHCHVQRGVARQVSHVDAGPMSDKQRHDVLMAVEGRQVECWLPVAVLGRCVAVAILNQLIDHLVVSPGLWPGAGGSLCRAAWPGRGIPGPERGHEAGAAIRSWGCACSSAPTRPGRESPWSPPKDWTARPRHVSGLGSGSPHCRGRLKWQSRHWPCSIAAPKRGLPQSRAPWASARPVAWTKGLLGTNPVSSDPSRPVKGTQELGRRNYAPLFEQKDMLLLLRYVFVYTTTTPSVPAFPY